MPVGVKDSQMRSSGSSVQEWSVGQTLAATALSVAVAVGSAGPAYAENEAMALGAKGLDTSLIDTSCFKPDGACGAAAQNCVKTGDCRKGMTCTAKCLGDNACITGCFAKYGNEPMNELLECSIERHECIKIAILPPGPDTAESAPAPPATPVANFEPASLEGSWYKVMGWNSRYDCFDCQKNSFTANARDKNAMDVDVEFAMPRPARGATPSGEYPLKLSEKLVFDKKQAPSAVLSSKRHASTQGRMFGLTFWENWSVIGQNAKDEPEFKFVHYSGRTSQNTYEGAFVYAREPTLPPAAKASVYAIARNAGMEPSTFCAVRNDCKTCGPDMAAQPEDLAASSPDVVRSQQKGLFMGAATAAEVDEAGLVEARPDDRSFVPHGLRTVVNELSDYVEDPHVAEKWMFGQQKMMGE